MPPPPVVRVEVAPKTTEKTVAGEATKAANQAASVEYQPFGVIGVVVFNHLHPPFNNVKAREALDTRRK